jgi:hypothetical protein
MLMRAASNFAAAHLRVTVEHVVYRQTFLAAAHCVQRDGNAGLPCRYGVAQHD